MAQDPIRFGVELERKLDAEFQEIADYEERSKCSMTRVMIKRVVKLFKTNKQSLEELGLIQRGS